MKSEGNNKFSLWRVIGTISVVATAALFVTSIVKYRMGGLSKDYAILIGAIAFLPSLASVFFYSVINGETFAKGQRVIKSKTPKLYYTMTIFWGLMFFLNIFFIVIRTI